MWVLALAGCSPVIERSEGVRLMLADDTLDATTTFELRFEEPVAGDAQVGRAEAPSPLTIRPALAGQFVWLSPRGGVFTPTEPAKLGTEYRLSLQPGLTNSLGHQVTARLFRKVRTPDFGVSAHAPKAFNADNAPSHPRFFLQFNAPVNDTVARTFFSFVDARGNSRPAIVTAVTTEDDSDDRFSAAGSANPRTWTQEFQANRAGRTANQGAKSRSTSRPDATPDAPAKAPIPGRFMVMPEQPLPAGPGWKLVVEAGLPAAEDSRLRLAKPAIFPVGEVRTFTVAKVEAVNGLNTGRRLRIELSKPLSAKVTTTNAFDWIQVSPKPTLLKVMVGNDHLALQGSFELDQPYRVRILPGLPSAEGFTLDAAVEQEVSFKPLPPRLYFPAFSSEQLSGGTRRMELLSVNVPAVRVRAKLLDRHQLVHALRGYGSYFRDNPRWDDTYEPYQEVDFNVVAGKTIYGTNIVLDPKPDQPLKTTLAWDEILAGRPQGAVFLVAEMKSPTDPAEDDAPGARVSHARLGTQTLIQLTDLGFYWKTSPDRLWAVVFSYATGKPVAGATLRVLDNDGEVLAEQRADAAGLAVFETPPKAAWLMAQSGDDLHAVALNSTWENRLPVGDSISREWNLENHDHEKVMLFSDRPVYRPGETLHLKVLLRDWQNDSLSIPQAATAKLSCLDARDHPFFETNLAFSDLGSADASIPLPTQTRGSYRAEVRTGAGHSQAHWFLVEDFQPNPFELELSAPDAFAPSDPVEVRVQARYLHGRPVTKARLEWSLEAQDTGFSPAGWSGFAFCNQAYPYRGRSDTSVSLHGETNYTVDPASVLRPVIPMNPAAPQPRAIDLLVELTDVTQQTISHRAHFVRHSSDFYLGIKNPPSLLYSNQPLPVYVAAVRADGSPEPTPVKATLRLHRVEWRSVRAQGAGQVIRYQNEPELKLIAEQAGLTGAVRTEGGEWDIPANAPPAAVFTPPAAGQYLLEATATDSGGREALTALEFNVLGAEKLGWNYRNEAQIDLIPDRKEYRVGQVATILVKTPIAGAAVVSVEREHVYQSYSTNLAGNAPAIQIPILPGYAPNVMVAVFLTRGSADNPHQFKEPEYRIGYCNLTINNPEARLVVATGPERPDYRPGEAVAIAGTVSNDQGQPAANAEVTCYAVDEGVLSLTGYRTPDPFEFFWEPRPLAVFSHSTLPSLLPEDPAQRHFQNKGYLIGDGGQSPGDALRKNFLPCAYWNPGLRTDAQGRFSVRFTAPDSLTRYRVIAVVHASQGRFGQGESSFRVHKPLMLEPALPRFAHVGDRLVARAVAHNQTAASAEVQVTLRLDDKAKGSTPEFTGAEGQKRFTIPATNNIVVEFPIEFTATGTSRWTWEASSATHGELRDRVESLIPVEAVAPLLREVYLTRSVTAATNLLARANPQLFTGPGTLTVVVANSRFAELGEAVAALLHYPYGCAEQTSSSLLPWIALRDVLPFLPGKHAAPDEVTKVIAQGIERLLAMQTTDGGLAYWPGGDRSTPWVSAYGAMTLGLAQKSGHRVPAVPFEALLKYLSESLPQSAKSRENEELSGHCLALFALASVNRAQPAFHEQLFDKRALLSTESQALLALAILEAHGPRDMARELLLPKVKPRSQGDQWFGCPEREIAIQLLAWLREDPNDPRLDTLAEELLHTQQQGRWTTTQGNAWGLLALADHVARIESAHPAGAGTLEWAAERRPFQLSAQPRVFETVFTLQANPGQRELTLENPDRGPLFARALVEFRPAATRQPRQDRGFGLRRRYELLDDDGKLQDLKQARVGDRVVVTLEIETRQAARYVAVEDPMPAVLEPSHPEFASRETRAGHALEMDWWSDFHEFRHDRALFFRDFLPPGHHRLQYLARVRAAGTVVAPGAKIEEMYHPERFGLSETVELQTRSEE